jgi:hypothetical protein
MNIIDVDDTISVHIDLYGYEGIFYTPDEDVEYNREQLDHINQMCCEFVSDLAKTSKDKVLMIDSQYYVYLVNGQIHNREHDYPFTEAADLDDVMDYVIDNMFNQEEKFWSVINRPKYLKISDV